MNNQVIIRLIKGAERKGDYEDYLRRLSTVVIETHCTTRQAAKAFGYSPSTIYRDLTRGLLDNALYRQYADIQIIFRENREAWYRRGRRAK
jgi:IS30 family transposase